MMPYTRNELVFSKFLIGYIGVAVTSVISIGIQLVIAAVNGQAIAMEQILSVVLIAFASVFLLAIYLPFLFWLGVERGRILFLVLMAIMFLGMMSIDSIKKLMELSTITPAKLLLGGAVAAIAANAVSVTVSKHAYMRKFI